MSSTGVSHLLRKKIHRMEEPNESLVEVAEGEENECETSHKSSPNSSNIYPDLSSFSEENSFCSESSASSIKEEEDKEIPKNFYFYILLGGVFLFAVLISLYFYHFRGTEKTEVQKEMEDTPLLAINKMLKNKYPNLSNLSRKIIKESLRHVLSPNSISNAPSIILLVSSSGSEDITYKLSEDLASSLHNEYFEFKCQQKKYSDRKDIKRQLGDQLQKFKKGQLNVLLIKDIEYISGEVAMILHSHSDHENAPFKKSVIIMTASSKESIAPESDSKAMDSYALSLLREAWNDTESDQLESLLSRLTVSVAAVQ